MWAEIFEKQYCKQTEMVIILLIHLNFVHHIIKMFRSGWYETNFLGRDRDREIRLIKNHYETETEK